MPWTTQARNGGSPQPECVIGIDIGIDYDNDSDDDFDSDSDDLVTYTAQYANDAATSSPTSSSVGRDRRACRRSATMCLFTERFCRLKLFCAGNQGFQQFQPAVQMFGGFCSVRQFCPQIFRPVVINAAAMRDAAIA